MPHPIKIATCCYCGARAALRLDKARHELACASCGAPLRTLKRLQKPEADAPTRRAAPERPRFSEKPCRSKPSDRRRRKQKRRKLPLREFFEEAFDVIEDIFD